MTARDALRALNGRLRNPRSPHGEPPERLSRGEPSGFGPVVGPELAEGDFWQPPQRAPLDYAEEELPFAARPMFGLCEKVLIGSLVVAGLLGLWMGLS